MISQDGSSSAPMAFAKGKTAMTPEEFSLETRFVMLNFLGLVPATQSEAPGSGILWQSSHASSSSGSSKSQHSRSNSASSHPQPQRDLSLDTSDTQPSHISNLQRDQMVAWARAGIKKFTKSHSLPYPAGGDFISTPTTNERARQGRPHKLMKTKSVTSSEDSARITGENFLDQNLLPDVVQLPRRDHSSPVHNLNPYFEEGVLETEGETEESSPYEVLDSKDGKTSRKMQYMYVSPQVKQGKETNPETIMPFSSRQPISSSSNVLSEELLIEDQYGPTGEAVANDLTDSGNGKMTDLETRSLLPEHPNARVYRHTQRSRSESPARPTTLDLTSDAARSLAIPNWRSLVCLNSGQWDKDEETDDDVDMAQTTRPTGIPYERYESGSSSEQELDDAMPRDMEEPQQSVSSQQGALDSPDKSRPAVQDLEKHQIIDDIGIPSASKGQPLPHRQDSNISTLSTSLPSPNSEFSSLGDSGRLSRSSQRTSLIELDKNEVSMLVSNRVLPPVAATLKEELNQQLEQWETEYEEALQNETARELWTPTPSGDSPESEVARRLGIIGDQVQEEYGEVLNTALNGIMSLPRDRVTYDVFMNILFRTGLLSTRISSWQQVALLMLFSKRLVVKLLQQGERHLGGLVDFTVRVINDRAASFIINQGGWGAISELELESPISVGDVTTNFIAEHEMHWQKLREDQEQGNAKSEVDGATFTNGVHRNVSDGNANDILPNVTPQPATVVATDNCDQNANRMDETMGVSGSGRSTPPTPTTPKMPDLNKPSSHGMDKSRGPSGDYRPYGDGQLTPEESKAVEDAINNLRPEIHLIRQVSSDLRSEIETSKNGDDWPYWQQLMLYTGAVAAVAMGTVIVYKYLKRN